MDPTFWAWGAFSEKISYTVAARGMGATLLVHFLKRCFADTGNTSYFLVAFVEMCPHHHTHKGKPFLSICFTDYANRSY